MTEAPVPVEGEVIDKKIVAAHGRNMAGFRKGLAAMCIAMERIRKGKTYLAEGKNNFTEFCEAHQISRTSGYRLASAGAMFELADSQIRENVLTLEVLVPIEKMAPDNQVRCLQLAIEVAQGPPAKWQVEDVAAQHFNWFAKPKTGPDDKSPLLKRLEKAFGEIADLPLTAEEAEAEFGDPRHWKDFPQAFTIMKELWSVGEEKTSRQPGSDDDDVTE